jgi:hypothetical protein
VPVPKGRKHVSPFKPNGLWKRKEKNENTAKTAPAGAPANAGKRLNFYANKNIIIKGIIIKLLK